MLEEKRGLKVLPVSSSESRPYVPKGRGRGEKSNLIQPRPSIPRVHDLELLYHGLG